MSGTGRDQYYIPESSGTGASPGFSFGRSGNITAVAYLQNESVPSNITGRPIDLSNGRITQISVSNELANTFTITLEEHDGVTFTTLGTFSLSAERSKKFSGLSIAISSGKEMAAKVSAGSGKNIIVTVYVKGDTV